MSDPRSFDAATWERVVEEWDWTFASTMADIPHWYVVRHKPISGELWDALAAFIKEHGFKGIWTSPGGHKRRNIYLRLGEWQYWVLPPVINRDVAAKSNVERVDGGQQSLLDAKGDQ